MFASRSINGSEQQGVNIVDLMMWLVIAALMLAAAIQGIGYYQKAAYMHQMKFNLAGAGSNVMSLSSTTGDLDKTTAEEALADSQWNEDIGYTVEETSADDMPYLRATHPQVTDRDVIYLFEHCGPYAVGINVIPKDGNPILDNCGIAGSGGATEPVPTPSPAPPQDTHLASWGYNSYGALGLGSTNVSESPASLSLPAGMSGKVISEVAAGEGHACALVEGAVWCWGWNLVGQLGNGTTTDSRVPVLVEGILSGKTVTKLTVGNRHACVLADGAPYCWGAGGSGRLGNNSVANSSLPVPVVTSGALAGKTITDIASGDGQSCVVASGAAYCWGFGSRGALGTGSTSSSSVPIAVSATGVLSGKTVTRIASGTGNTCAIASGSAYCWGGNAIFGPLGNGMGTDSLVPVAVTSTGVLSGKTLDSIEGSYLSYCVISNGEAYCWGLNNNGQIGDGTTTDALSPVAVDKSGAIAGRTVTDISVGATTTCAVADNEAFCWGYNGDYTLGDGTSDNSSVPKAVSTSGPLSGKQVIDIAADESYGMVVYN